MADRSILYRIRAALQGGFVAVAREVELLASYVGVLNGVNNTETALQRVDGTGIGAAIFRFTGAFSAQASNIDDWFGGKQLVRLRCIDSGTGVGISGAVRFDLPGTTALNTAFDTLVTNGLAEQITFIIEYTGAEDDFLQIFPRIPPSPQITNTSSIIVRSGVAATIEITRSSGTISNYVFQAIGAVGNESSLAAGSVRLINPTNAVWDASDNGPLPTTGVAQGNAYKVVNAPADGSGRFGEVMQNDDWVVWQGTTFTSWSAMPLQWFVIPAHDVRRISALEQDFLTDIEITTPVTDRNGTVRGADYATQVGEIRLKIYVAASDYNAADLNTTGDIDEYTNPSDINGRLGIRLPGTQSSIQSTLPTLWVYAEDGGGNFTRLLNLDRDFTHQGDFGAESDYLSDTNISYTTGETLRIYVTTDIDRYNAPNLDITESNLTDDVQGKLNAPGHGIDLPEALAALNQNARVFFITHSNFRSNNVYVYLTQSFAFLKNAPTTFPNTGGAFENEIAGSDVTPDDPSLVTDIQDVSTVTNNILTGPGIVNASFGINGIDPNNWRLVIGGWMYYDTIPSSYQSILRVRERAPAGIVYRDVFGMGPNGITFKRRNTTGTTNNVSIRHPLNSVNGRILESLTAATLQTEFRIFTAKSYRIQVSGYNADVLTGGQALDYVVTNIATAQAESPLVFDVGPGNQTLQISFIPQDNDFQGTNHVIRVRAASLIGGIDELRVDIIDLPSTVETSEGNTYTDLTLDSGHVAAGRLMRYIASFRSVTGEPDSNLECVISFFGYDSNGRARVFDENTLNLNYPALDLEWDDMLYGGTGVHQNIQGFNLTPDTILFDFPTHARLNTWETSYDDKEDDYCWRNIHGPDQDTEAVSFPETVSFPNIINSPIVSTGTTVPTTTPGKLGDIFVDTTNKRVYIAVGNATSGDWEAVN